MTILKYADFNANTKGVSERNAFPVRLSTSIPRTGVTPDVSAASKTFQEFGDGTVEVIALRYTINADDDIDAGNRLLNGFPDVGQLTLDAQHVIEASAAITKVHVVAMGVTTAGTPAAGTPIGVVGGIGTDATEAQTRTSMVEFNFDTADDVRMVTISITAPYTATAAPATADAYVGALVEGHGFA